MRGLLPIILGGIAPAMLWGLTSVLQKLSATAAVGPGRYLTIFGITIACCGGLYALVLRESFPTLSGSLLAVAAGLAFAVGTGLLSFVLYQYDYPISRLAPVLGVNAVVPVVIGLIFLGEGTTVDLTRLILGLGVTLLGVLLVTSA
jgi:drug/metabolite transporter (DMT)-like permease